MMTVLKKFRKPLVGFLIAALLAVIVIGGSFLITDTNNVSGSVSKQELEQRIRIATDYLTESVNEDGSFIYEFDPVRNVNEDGYNILRHAGTIYSMFESYDAFPRVDVRTQGELAIEYLIAQMRSCNSGQALCVEESREVKLGGNGLAMLALIEYSEATNTRNHDETIHKLAHWILSVQSDEGEFTLHKADYPSMRDSGFLSTYYPGEAIYALARACQMLDTQEYCTAAENGATWLITVRDADIKPKDLPHDHWLLYGLRELSKVSDNPLYVEQSEKIAYAIINDQITESKENPHWVGGFYEPPRSAPTATRMEGLVAAYETGEPSYQYKKDLKKSLKLGIAMLKRLQLTPAALASDEISIAKQGLGGFIRGFGQQDIRIDYVQHALSAMLGYYRNF